MWYSLVEVYQKRLEFWNTVRSVPLMYTLMSFETSVYTAPCTDIDPLPFCPLMCRLANNLSCLLYRKDLRAR
jgi:hypothetical protein